MKAQAIAAKGYLFSPTVDFWMVGGISFILLAMYPLFATHWPIDAIVFSVFFIEFFINWPHFLFSYLLLYENYGKKLSDEQTSKGLKIRYVWAGVVAPLIILGVMGMALTGYYAVGYLVNAMYFFVGWHYVRQGYGVLMVLSAKKKVYYGTAERRILQTHAYSAWIFAWLTANTMLLQRDFNGILFQSFEVPPAVGSVAFMTFLVSSLVLLHTLFKKFYKTGLSVPANAIVGYVCGSIVWVVLVGIHPAFVLLFPILHSLQYLLFVLALKRRQAEAESTPAARWYQNRFYHFIILGFALGALGFFYIPHSLDLMVPYDTALFGGTLFFALFHIFINIHHYFIDNAIWRRENPLLKNYL